MAKGNLFLGLARGSVGDVTMYRRDGNQVSRARVRKIANPQSQGQVYTRAILSTVAKAYSAGKAVFDHSFEGYPVPEGAQRRFLKLNMDALRARVYADIEQQTDVPYSNPLVGPNAPSPVAGEYIVSEGSLPQTLITTSASSVDDPVTFTFGNPESGETMGDFFSRLGIAQGDIFTIIFLASGSVMAGLTPKTVFAWIQLEVGQYDASASVTGTYFDDIFRFAKSANITAGDFLFSPRTYHFGEDVVLNDRDIVWIDGIGLENDAQRYFGGTYAIIRSRRDSPLRSSAQMQWLFGDDHGGLAWSQVVDAWTGGYQLGESDLLLEGSEIPRQVVSFMTANFSQPTSIAALAAASSPALSFREPVSSEDIGSRLTIVGANLSLVSEASAGTFRITDGSDNFGTASLSSDGKRLAISALGSGPAGFSFVWQ